METLSHIINNQHVTARPHEWGNVYNPATGAVIGQVPLDDGQAVDQAVEASHQAYLSWADTPILERARVMFRFRELLVRHQEEVAALITQEHGKIFSDAYGEVGRAIEVVELAAGAPSLLKGEWLPHVAHGIETSMLRVPLGVVAGITAFNFPAMIPLWMIPPAIVCGNTFILKPSEQTPLTSMRLWELLQEAGVPAGVVNIVHGGRQVAENILQHPGIQAVSFVGSQPVAEYIYHTASRAGKRVQALGGAKNYHVVMPDADLPRTVEALTSSAFGSAGERCLAGSVVIAVGDIAGELAEAMADRATRLKVGEGMQEDSEMGPLIRARHLERVTGYIERGVAQGASLVYDGRQHPVPREGFFLGPTLFDQVTSDMTIAQEEIFGPVLSMMREPTLEDAVRTANRSRYGNTATIYTDSGQAAQYFRNRIEAGMVGINVGIPAPVAWFPFAGWKNSFYGDLHATGLDAFWFYTERRVITTRW